jgi:hypothetical protein
MQGIPRRAFRTKGRGALLWTLAAFALGQAALGWWVLGDIPKMTNPTWDFRLARLRARMAEAPGRPLLLVLGSSRVANGFSPADVGDWAPPGRPAPVVFNFSILGGGPIRELLTLRRLLHAGIRPQWVVAEVWPAFWPDRGRYEERTPILTGGLELCDVPVLAHTYHEGWTCFARVCSQHLTPLIHYRTGVLFAHAPFLVPAGTDPDFGCARYHWWTLDDWGWLPVPWPKRSPKDFTLHIEEARLDTVPLFEDMHMTPQMDWAGRELIRTCRREGIELLIVVMPEHSALRSWYPARTRAMLADHLARLRHEDRLPVIDARDWADDDDFADFCHLMPDGGRAFSARFAREVLRPWVAGEPLPMPSLQRPPAASGTPRSGS